LRDVFSKLRSPHIVIEAALKFGAEPGKQVGLAQHHAASQEDAARRCCEYQDVQQLRQRVGHERPHWSLLGERCRARARALLDCGTGGQALKAVTVKGARATPGIAGEARNADVAQFAVREAQHRAAGNHHANTDAGTHGHVGQIRKTSGSTPARFGARGAIDIRVKAHWDVERAAERSGHISRFSASS
jgi:hypothetical protein